MNNMLRQVGIFTILVATMLAAQNKSTTPATTSVAQESNAARTEIAELKKRVALLESRLDLYHYLLKTKQDKTDELTLDVTSKGFSKVDTSNGPVLVSVQDVSPYLDGYK